MVAACPAIAAAGENTSYPVRILASPATLRRLRGNGSRDDGFARTVTLLGRVHAGRQEGKKQRDKNRKQIAGRPLGWARLG